MFSVAGIPPLAGFYSKLGILLCLLSEGHLFSCLLIVFFSSIACFYYIKLIKIFYFSSITKSSFWFGSGDNHVEFFVCFGTILVTTLLVRPNFILDCITITALALS
jgi:NADH-quinone oxidoreductase subunit N